MAKYGSQNTDDKMRMILQMEKCGCQANKATAAQLKVMALSQATEQEAHAVNQKEGFKKPKTPKENGKGSKDQLNTECKYCGHKRE